jgi:hypothetical protein
VYLVAPTTVQALDYQPGSTFGGIMEKTCGASASQVSGKYEGMNNVNYKKGATGEQKMTITVDQTGSQVKVSYQTVDGGQGYGDGTLDKTRVDSMQFQSTAPSCPGSYDASLSFNGNDLSFTFKGKDCNGEMQGHGNARKVQN